MSRPLRVAIIRGGEWDCTQAVPRSLNVLESMGLRATILCWDLSGKRPRSETVRGHQIIRFRRYVPPRSIRMFLWWPAWWAWVLRHLLRGRFDLIIAMNFDTLPPAVTARALSKAKLIYDVRDPFGLMVAKVRRPVPEAFTLMERTLTQAADGLILSQGDTAGCAGYFGRRAARTLPMTNVLNVPWVEPDIEPRPPTGRPLRINISGYISPVRGAFALADLIEGRDDLACDVVGELRYPAVERRLRELPNATLYGRVDYARALELMNAADLVWLHYDNSVKNVRIASANKMFEAMMLNKPYLTADGCWMADIARKHALGWSVPYADGGALRELLDQLTADPTRLVAAGQRGRECFEKIFRWRWQRDNMVRLFRHVLDLQCAPLQQSGPWMRSV